MPPTDAERMSGGVGVHLVAFGSIEIRSRLQQSGAEADCLFMRSSRILDMEVEMHLLRGSVRPVGRNVVGCQLHTDPPLSSAVDDAVSIVVLEDVPPENASPERALGSEVCRVENDHLTHHLHHRETMGPTCRPATGSARVGMADPGGSGGVLPGGLGECP